jgi:RNA polymerase sigma factor (sigma-70 family)
MERAFARVAAHQSLDVDLFAGSEDELIEGARSGCAEEMAAVFLASAAPSATPEEEIIELEGRRLDREALRGALATLPPEEQRVIDLVYRENMTLAEVARETGVHANTAWKRHVSALRTLRAILTREMSRRRR